MVRILRVTTGHPVYYNEITEEKTWELPKHAKITWVDEDSIDGEKCPTYDPENLGKTISIHRGENLVFKRLDIHTLEKLV